MNFDQVVFVRQASTSVFSAWESGSQREPRRDNKDHAAILQTTAGRSAWKLVGKQPFCAQSHQLPISTRAAYHNLCSLRDHGAGGWGLLADGAAAGDCYFEAGAGRFFNDLAHGETKERGHADQGLGAHGDGCRGLFGGGLSGGRGLGCDCGRCWGRCCGLRGGFLLRRGEPGGLG